MTQAFPCVNGGSKSAGLKVIYVRCSDRLLSLAGKKLLKAVDQFSQQIWYQYGARILVLTAVPDEDRDVQVTT